MRMVVDPQGEGTLVHFVTATDKPDDEGLLPVHTVCGRFFRVSARHVHDTDLALTNRAELCFQCFHLAKIQAQGAET